MRINTFLHLNAIFIVHMIYFCISFSSIGKHDAKIFWQWYFSIRPKVKIFCLYPLYVYANRYESKRKIIIIIIIFHNNVQGSFFNLTLSWHYVTSMFFTSMIKLFFTYVSFCWWNKWEKMHFWYAKKNISSISHYTQNNFIKISNE